MVESMQKEALHDLTTAMTDSALVVQGTFLPANVSEQLDDMASHATLKTAAAKVKQQYAKLRAWRSSLSKQSAEDLSHTMSHEDLAVELESVLKQ